MTDTKRRGPSSSFSGCAFLQIYSHTRNNLSLWSLLDTVFNIKTLIRVNGLVHIRTRKPQAAMKERERSTQSESQKLPRNFFGGPVARAPCFQCRGPGSILGQRTRFHLLKLKICVSATTKTQYSQTKQNRTQDIFFPSMN